MNKYTLIYILKIDTHRSFYKVHLTPEDTVIQTKPIILHKNPRNKAAINQKVTEIVDLILD